MHRHKASRQHLNCSSNLPKESPPSADIPKTVRLWNPTESWKHIINHAPSHRSWKESTVKWNPSDQASQESRKANCRSSPPFAPGAIPTVSPPALSWPPAPLPVPFSHLQKLTQIFSSNFPSDHHPRPQLQQALPEEPLPKPAREVKCASRAGRWVSDLHLCSSPPNGVPQSHAQLCTRLNILASSHSLLQIPGD